MAHADPVKRVNRAVQALRDVPDPLGRLRAVHWASQLVEDLEAAAVSAARESGATWQDIGAVYGLTKQGAQQRFGSVSGGRPSGQSRPSRPTDPGQPSRPSQPPHSSADTSPQSRR